MLGQNQKFNDLKQFEHTLGLRLIEDRLDPTKFSISTGNDAVLDDLFSYQVYNKIKNHWRSATAPADGQDGMIFSDSDDNELYHYYSAAWNKIGSLAFKTMNCPAGTDPVADAVDDTLNLTTSGGFITVTGTVASDTIDFLPLVKDEDDFASNSATYMATQQSIKAYVAATFFTQAEHINTSAGAADAGKPIKLDATGKIDGTMVSAGAVDHGSLAGLADNDHSQYYTPVGSIIAWIGGYFTNGANAGYTRVLGTANTVAAANTYLNPFWWYVADGAALNDADSPIWVGANRYLPNLTDDRFIMGDTIAGGIGGSSTMAHTHTVNPASVTSAAGTAHSHGTSGKTSGAGTSHTHDVSGTSGNASVSHTHNMKNHTHTMQNHTHAITGRSHVHGGVTVNSGNTAAENGCDTPTGVPNNNTSAAPSDNATTTASVTHTHSFSDTSTGEATHTHSYNRADQSESAHTHDVDVAVTTSSAASNAENRPKYLAAFMIVKIK